MRSVGEVQKLIRQAESNLQTAKQLQEETPWYVSLFRDGSAEKKSKQKMGLAEEQLFQAREQLYKFSNSKAAIALVKKALKNSIEAHDAVRETDQTVIRRGTTVSEITMGAGAGLFALGTAGAGAIAAGGATVAGVAIYGGVGTITTSQLATFAAASTAGGAMAGYAGGMGMAATRSLATNTPYNYSSKEQFQATLQGGSIGLMQGTSPFAAATGFELSQSLPRTFVTLPKNTVIEGTIFTKGAMQLAPMVATNAAIAGGETIVAGGSKKDLAASAGMAAGITILNGAVFGTLNTVQNLKGARVHWEGEGEIHEGVVVYSQSPGGSPRQIASKTWTTSQPDDSYRIVGNPLLTFVRDETGALFPERVAQVAGQIWRGLRNRLGLNTPFQIANRDSAAVKGTIAIQENKSPSALAPQSGVLIDNEPVQLVRRPGAITQRPEPGDAGTLPAGDTQILSAIIETIPADSPLWTDLVVECGIQRIRFLTGESFEPVAKVLIGTINHILDDAHSENSAEGKKDAILFSKLLARLKREGEINVSRIADTPKLQSALRRIDDLNRRDSELGMADVRVPKVLDRLVDKMKGAGVRESFSPESIEFFEAFAIDITKQRGVREEICEALAQGKFMEALALLADAPDLVVYFDVEISRGATEFGRPHRLDPRFPKAIEELAAAANQKTNFNQSDRVHALAEKARGSVATPPPKPRVSLDPRAVRFLRERGIDGTQEPLDLLRVVFSPKHLDAARDRSGDGLLLVMNLATHFREHGTAFQKTMMRELLEAAGFNPDGSLNREGLPSYRPDPPAPVREREPVEQVGARTAAIRAGGSYGVAGELGQGSTYEAAFRGACAPDSALLDFWVAALRSVGPVDSPEKFSAAFILLLREFVSQLRTTNAPEYYKADADALIRFIRGSAEKTGVDLETAIMDDEGALEDYETLRSFQKGETVIGDQQSFHRQWEEAQALDPVVATWRSGLAQELIDIYFHHPRLIDFVEKQRRIAEHVPIGPLGPLANKDLPSLLKDAFGQSLNPVRFREVEALKAMAEIMALVEKVRGMGVRVPIEEQFWNEAKGLVPSSASAKTIIRHPPPPPAVDLEKLAPTLTSPTGIQSFFTGPVSAQKGDSNFREYGWGIEYNESGKVVRHFVAVGDRNSVSFGDLENVFHFAHNHLVDQSNKGRSVVHAEHDMAVLQQDIARYIEACSLDEVPESPFYRGGKFYDMVYSEEGICVVETNVREKGKNWRDGLKIYFTLRPGSTGDASKIREDIVQKLKGFTGFNSVDGDGMVEVPWEEHFTHPAFSISAPETLVTPGAKTVIRHPPPPPTLEGTVSVDRGETRPIQVIEDEAKVKSLDYSGGIQRSDQFGPIGYFLDKGVKKVDPYSRGTPFGGVENNIRQAIEAKRKLGDRSPVLILSVGPGYGILELELKRIFGADIVIDVFSLTSVLKPEARSAIRREYIGNLNIHSLPRGYDRLLAVHSASSALHPANVIENIVQALVPGGEAFVNLTNNYEEGRFPFNEDMREHLLDRGVRIGWLPTLTEATNRTYIRKEREVGSLDWSGAVSSPAQKRYQLTKNGPDLYYSEKEEVEAVIGERLSAILNERGYDTTTLSRDANYSWKWMVNHVYESVGEGIPIDDFIHYYFEIMPDAPLLSELPRR